MDKNVLLNKVNQLMAVYQKGDLGGAVMPEDENPHLELGSAENYLYFTLPMALNYQKNSYVLWECAYKMFKNHPEIFDSSAGFSVAKIKAHIAEHKKEYPYLGGTKICNYWLHVMERYTDARFVDRENITVAPDTHVIQASTRLGLICEQEATGPAAQEITATRWNVLLNGTHLKPIDVHTPLWLWSRGKFAMKSHREVTRLEKTNATK